jgi:YkoY family integral membrane protein
MMMFGQTFSLSDIPRVAVLAVLEILLSADNAIVLGLIVSRLPSALRRRALTIGYVSALVFRLSMIIGVAFLLKYPWIQLAGGLYLLYLAIHFFLKKAKKDPLMPQPSASFWKTVLMIEFFDLAFAIDSIIAGVAFIGMPAAGQEVFYPKLWIVYIGGMIGVFAIRFAAKFFSSMIHLFSRLEISANVMIGWIGLKLSLQSLSLTFPYFEVVFWTVLVFLFLFGLTKAKKNV